MFIFDSNLDSKTLKISPKPPPEAEITEEDADEKEVEEEVILFNLSDEDIEFIYDNTHYSLKDIKDWHRFDHHDLFLKSLELSFYILGALQKIVQMGSCTNKRLQKFMMKLCQMETTNFLLTKFFAFSIKMQMDILTLR